MNKYTERDVLIWLSSLGVKNKAIDRLRSYFPDLREILVANKKLLFSIKTVNDNYLNKIVENRNSNYMVDLFNKLEKYGIETITILDKDYPNSLEYIYDKPYVLYGKGSMTEADRLSIGIVGARKATAYGTWACEKFTKELVNMDVTIVSGLALGIDAVAHKTAIQEGGRTIGVLGNGIDRIYPKRNERLYGEIPNRGMVLTEFPLGTEPMPYNFPQRNRIIAGLSLGIIVIEAKEKSGSLITAHHALEQGKDVFSLPGNINSIYSKGTNRLIKDGARPLLDIEDIIEEIKELQTKLLKEKKEDIDYSHLSNMEISVISTLGEGPLHCDLITYKSGLDISSVISTLTILELKGIIKEISSRTFTLC